MASCFCYIMYDIGFELFKKFITCRSLLKNVSIIVNVIIFCHFVLFLFIWTLFFVTPTAFPDESLDCLGTDFIVKHRFYSCTKLDSLDLLSKHCMWIFLIQTVKELHQNIGKTILSDMHEDFLRLSQVST